MNMYISETGSIVMPLQHREVSWLRFQKRLTFLGYQRPPIVHDYFSWGNVACILFLNEFWLLRFHHHHPFWHSSGGFEPTSSTCQPCMDHSLIKNKKNFQQFLNCRTIIESEFFREYQPCDHNQIDIPEDYDNYDKYLLVLVTCWRQSSCKWSFKSHVLNVLHKLIS